MQLIMIINILGGYLDLIIIDSQGWTFLCFSPWAAVCASLVISILSFFVGRKMAPLKRIADFSKVFE